MKKKIFLIVGYHYLTNPIWDVMRARFPNYDVKLVNLLDYFSPHANDEMISLNPENLNANYIQLDDDTAFSVFRKKKRVTKLHKIIQLTIGALYLTRYKNKVNLLMSFLYIAPTTLLSFNNLKNTIRDCLYPLN